MNSIVEQACNSVNGHSAPDAFNLIEQQAERIKELEAWRDSWVKCPEGAAAQRIKELEAELASIAEGVKISVPTQTMEQEFQNHYRRGYEAGKAALRQRIADAPVVAWKMKGYTDVFSSDAEAVACNPKCWKPLISKEDLKNG